MPLYRLTALIAVMLIIALSAGYAAGEDVADDEQEATHVVSADSHL
jgi:hypothetical protein